MSYSWPDFTFPPINLWNVPAQPYAAWALSAKEPPAAPKNPALPAARQDALRKISEISKAR